MRRRGMGHPDQQRGFRVGDRRRRADHGRDRDQPHGGIGTWETFNLVPLTGVGPGFYAIRTFTGNYLTAVNSGGIGSAFEAIHSNAIQIGTWEEFYFSCHLAA